MTYEQWTINSNRFWIPIQNNFVILIWKYDSLAINWSSKFGTYRLCEQRRFRRACASAQSRQNLRCSLIQAVSQEEPSDRKPDPWPFWIAGHAQLKFVMTECSKTQIRLTGLNWRRCRCGCNVINISARRHVAHLKKFFMCLFIRTEDIRKL